MKPMDIKNKILFGISMIAFLGITYWLCRFSFFELHGMKKWPNLLAILSIAIIIIAAIFGNRIIPLVTVEGYLLGFILAMMFNSDGVDLGGGRTNNAWLIWGTVYIISILIGMVIGFINKHRHKNVKG